jgi:hypothetical protein
MGPSEQGAAPGRGGDPALFPRPFAFLNEAKIGTNKDGNGRRAPLPERRVARVHEGAAQAQQDRVQVDEEAVRGGLLGVHLHLAALGVAVDHRAQPAEHRVARRLAEQLLCRVGLGGEGGGGGGA